MLGGAAGESDPLRGPPMVGREDAVVPAARLEGSSARPTVLGPGAAKGLGEHWVRGTHLSPSPFDRAVPGAPQLPVLAAYEEAVNAMGPDDDNCVNEPSPDPETGWGRSSGSG